MIGAATSAAAAGVKPLDSCSLISFAVVLARRLGRALRQSRIVIAHSRLIGRARTRVQLLEQSVISLRGLQLGNSAVRVVDIPKDDRFRGAGLLAGGDNFAVAQFPVLLFGLDLCR